MYIILKTFSSVRLVLCVLEIVLIVGNIVQILSCFLMCNIFGPNSGVHSDLQQINPESMKFVVNSPNSDHSPQ